MKRLILLIWLLSTAAVAAQEPTASTEQPARKPAALTEQPARKPAGPIELLARDPAGHGLLCRMHGKRVLMVAGTPEQMGAAHGHLLKRQAALLVERFVYAVGAGDTLRTGRWFFDSLAEVEQRTGRHVPERYGRECDALADASGLSRRDVRYANLLPERFHCSGVAVRGSATRGGEVLHARVLDYMREINLQSGAVVVLFMPKGRHAWMSLGYAGMVGTVTAMNEKGLAVGEMGGRGEGKWDGMPMCYLLREIMERAATVEEALALLKATPRTCEYYYVFSDRGRNVAAAWCTPEKVEVLRPGEQHPELPEVPADTVFVSGGSRAKKLSERLRRHHGKIDVPTLIGIIKRPVAMSSNLHNAIFAPERLTLWAADAGRRTPACDEPYGAFALPVLRSYFRKHGKPTAAPQRADGGGAAPEPGTSRK